MTCTQEEKKPQKTGRKTAATAKSDALEAKKKEAHESFSQASRTKEAYVGYVVRSRALLADIVAERRQKLKDNPEWICPQGIDTDLLEKAFDTPNKHSVFALELYLTQKCIVENKGKSTCEGIHGAFAKHWDSMEGDKYSGPYRFDEATGIVSGCPACAQDIQSFVKVVKTKSNVKGAAATRNHAEAMPVEDMKKWMDWSKSTWPRSEINVPAQDNLQHLEKTKHIMMRAFASSGFTLWTRNFELKGWQKQQGYDNESRESNRYNIYEQSELPEIDMYTHLLLWLKFHAEHLDRDLEPTDYVFLYIAPNGVIHPKREMTLQNCQDLIDEFAKGAGLTKSYTTHSFRRGGAQYRFMFAPLGKRWSLAIIRWWGGWARGEKVDTLMRYLMDSLQSYETGHSDALCPIPREAEESFMGDHLLLKPVPTQEFRLVTSQIGNLNLAPTTSESHHYNHTSSPVALSSNPQTQRTSQYTLSAPSHLRTRRNPLVTVSDSISSLAAVAARGRNIPPIPSVIPGVSIPDIKKGDGAWREAVKQWEEGDPVNNLRPLRDWPKEWYSGGMRTVTGTKRTQHKLIAAEFARLGRSEAEFIKIYPIASKRIGALIKAIQQTNNELGISHARRGKTSA
ncbi:hypothetical protein C8J57DRAFT_1244177 [Mycena rebaudengoi]|nr:hypothetical protein C8J57DRAFT_1244177 [Mycena rebaudengoi]